MQMIFAGGCLGETLALRQSREQQCGQNADDADYHEQLDQCESILGGGRFALEEIESLPHQGQELLAIHPQVMRHDDRFVYLGQQEPLPRLLGQRGMVGLEEIFVIRQ
jgi:hypothetical protein